MTLKQLDANRRNAEKSTGPKTPEGKANSSLNSVKHGLTSHQNVVYALGETDEAFEAHVQSYVDSFQPYDRLELALVRRLAVSDWRLLRIERIEAGYLDLVASGAYNESLQQNQGTTYSDSFGDWTASGHRGGSCLAGAALAASTGCFRSGTSLLRRLSIDEVAEVLGTSRRTVNREWACARVVSLPVCATR